jgi:NAD(P)-dependent dehydrogenase (short-subunit alcohol dehydrogenase family)/pimeloyl-ACP methyl ester carboxylesterase
MIVETAEAKLAVRETGNASGPTVLLLHGFPDTAAVWDGVAQQLGERFRVVSYDMRGFGASTGPRGRAAYALPRLVADLVAVMDAVSPDRPLHLVGHDWGSVYTWEAVTDPALRHRIASYTTISGPCLDHVGHWLRRPSPRRLGQIARQVAKSWYTAAFQLPLLPEIVWRFAIAPRWPAGQPTIARDGVRGLGLYRANMLRTVRRPRERTTDVPVQLVEPLRDPFASPALSEGLERWAPRLWRRRVHAGHWVVRERPEVVARLVAEFVEHVEGAEPTRALRRARRGRGTFEHRLAVVTGAGSGIGRATALALVGRGTQVVGCDIDGAAAARTVGKANAYEVDVANAEQMERFTAQVLERHGVPDIVVNNAGIGLAGSFLATSTADWERILDVNLWGVIHGSRLFGGHMAQTLEGGHIVNVASAAAYTPSRILSAYSTTKAAVLMLSECLRAELAEAGVGVTAVCPGIIDTNITRVARWVGVDEAEQARRRELSAKLYARRRFGPEKVAEDVLEAIERNRAVAPVTPEAKVTYALSRLTPGVLRALARRDALDRR